MRPAHSHWTSSEEPSRQRSTGSDCDPIFLVCCSRITHTVDSAGPQARGRSRHAHPALSHPQHRHQPAGAGGCGPAARVRVAVAGHPGGLSGSSPTGSPGPPAPPHPPLRVDRGRLLDRRPRRHHPAVRIRRSRARDRTAGVFRWEATGDTTSVIRHPSVALHVNHQLLSAHASRRLAHKYERRSG